MKVKITLLLLLCLLNFSAFALRVDKALAFLRTQFVEEASLLRASTVGEDSRTCYIASDNFLAAMIFRIFDDPLFYKIRETLDSFGGGVDGLHEALLGINVNALFYERYNKFVDSVFGHFGGRMYPGKIVYELPKRSKPFTSWRSFADLVVYESLKNFYDSNLREATVRFERLMELWDGNGFEDSSYISSKLYETYKLALAVYLYELLNSYSEKIESYKFEIAKMRKIIDSLQDSNGGIVTNYKYDASSKKYVPMGDVNTETTCMILLAYLGKIVVKKEIEINDLSKITSGNSECIAIAFESPELKEIGVLTNMGFRKVKKFSNDVDSIVCWMGFHEFVKNIKMGFESSQDGEKLSEKDLKVYIISLEQSR
ncbi:MAG: hypothetical protein J7K69_00285 [Thermotogae bacterium]|nr:hypothetical protein [Thermotogota bacterium]